MVYAEDLKSSDRKVMWVRLPPRAQNLHKNRLVFRIYLNHQTPELI